MKKIIVIFLTFIAFDCYSQGGFPWERPLKVAWSGNGINFNSTSIFQDSSGVPSAVKWKGDTLACVFQWFRQPQGSLTWDRVAVKFSYDSGLNWSPPVPIVVHGIPSNYQRPFDPTLAVVNSDSLRIYFSSSDGIPIGGLDSSINTYSAISIDGINYFFEPGARFDHPTNKVIDPSIIFFNGNWQYSAPIGAPQDGAYHCLSNDGINFLQQSNYLSNFNHNWTGNFLVENNTELRFYGSGPQIWFNSSVDGFNWQGYTNTNITGGDPTVVKTDSNLYLIIFVGEPYLSNINEQKNTDDFFIYPNPVSDFLKIKSTFQENTLFFIYSATGALEFSGRLPNDNLIPTSTLCNGDYFLLLNSNNKTFTVPFKVVH